MTEVIRIEQYRSGIAEPVKAKKTVLVIDPDEMFHLYIQESLSGLNATVVRVSDHDSAINYMRFRSAPDMVIYDWYELIHDKVVSLINFLRSDEKFANTLQILATNEFYIEEIHGKLGTHDYICKNLPQDLLNHHFELLLHPTPEQAKRKSGKEEVLKLEARIEAHRTKLGKASLTNIDLDYIMHLARGGETDGDIADNINKLMDYLT